MSALFTPITVGKLKLPNRIVIAPMCQYSAENGNATDWHLIHLGGLMISGSGLLIVEATAVEPEGRITASDLGLYNDENEKALGRVVTSVRKYSDMPMSLQLAHAGRKASTLVPWKGGAQVPPTEPNGWQTVAPSPLPFLPEEVPPVALDKAGLNRIRKAFGEAARRAGRIGFDAIQMHSAHGYLLHEFLSPLSNQRTDEYGGSLENRIRFPLEVFETLRESFPSDRPVSVRVSGTDWAPDGWDIDQTIEYARALQSRGCAAINMSSGGTVPKASVPVAPGYQVPLARKLREATGMMTAAVGLITGYDHAESIVANEDADLVCLGRTLLFEPHWPWHAAAHLGARIRVPNQYKRSQPNRFRDLFEE